MENKEFRVEGYDEYLFRIIKLKPTQVLAFQSLLRKGTDEDSIEHVLESVLEKMEVKINDNWLPVKEKGKDIYYPAFIEDDVELTEKLIRYFMENFLKPVFQKSNG